MVVLGLGSNVGDRLHHLRSAYKHIKNIPGLQVLQVSPVYLSDALLLESNTEPEWNLPYLNLAIRCETTLTPLELLQHTKQIEKDMGRNMQLKWGPRPIDIDLLAWDSEVIFNDKLHIPHEQLHTRPFALWPLADVAPRWIYPLKNEFFGKTATEIAAQWPSRFSGEAPLHTQQISQRIDMPELVGILNVTPDSFSNDGELQSEHLLQQARELVKHGADILDLGAEASNPNAKPVDEKIEWQRLEPVLKLLLSERKNFLIKPKISIDTRHAYVAEKALALGVDWINDVGGLEDPAMQRLLAQQTCDIVMMHHLGLPVSQSQWLNLNENPTQHILDWAYPQLDQLLKKGINPERIIFDVGIGFGKTAPHSLELLQHIDDFKKLNLRLLIGHSRKSFLTLFTPKAAHERDIETLPVSLFLAKQGVDYLRIHQVEICSRAFRVQAALC